MQLSAYTKNWMQMLYLIVILRGVCRCAHDKEKSYYKIAQI
jgi:hypothetical protein